VFCAGIRDTLLRTAFHRLRQSSNPFELNGTKPLKPWGYLKYR
jgi:hypothetical protein